MTGVLSYAQVKQLKGRVISKADGKAVVGATISVKDGRGRTLTDEKGNFNLALMEPNAQIIVSHTGFSATEISAGSVKEFAVIELLPEEQVLEEVTISTGYQSIPKERATGSFSFVDNELFNRTVSTDVISRLENTAPGLLFNKGDAGDTDPLLIRGRSTIHADASPLIVLDDFPYDGDLRNLNPNDIESVSILKDAAAASIWGARAGNGVIVITTKKGKIGKPSVHFNTNLTLKSRPDLYSIRQISSADAIELEKELFDRGAFESAFTGPYFDTPLTPVIELLASSDPDAKEKIEQMKNFDVRDDISRYLYQNTVNQQYGLSISGASDKVNYLVSTGYDNNRLSLVGNGEERFTFRTVNSFQITDRLRADASLQFTQTNGRQGENLGYNTGRAKAYYPYARLVGDNGEPLPLYLDYRQGYVDSVGRGALLDWNYSPIEELRNVKESRNQKDILLKTGLSYNILNSLSVDARYQYQNQQTDTELLYSEDSYFARDLINQYAQYNSARADYSFPIPRGGILDGGVAGVNGHQGRIQINFHSRFGIDHEVTALAGYEIRNRVTTNTTSRIYGYEAEYGISNTLVDYITRYRLLSSGLTARVPARQSRRKYVDNFMSYFMNASYSFKNRYTLTGSFRKDEANLFGVAANQKGTPLWSVGVAWNAANEDFLKDLPVRQLILRATYGVNGNISRLASAHTTASFGSSFMTGLRNASVLSLPNKNLQWEEVKTLNLGLDLKLAGDKLYATMDFYTKNGIGLLAQAPIDPTYGRESFYGNVAETKGKGIDLALGSRVLNRGIKWNTDILFSYAHQQTAEYLMPVSTSPVPYLSEKAINPVIDRPLYSVYSFRWHGLDPENGDPVGYFDGETSKDYSAIYNRTPLDSLVFHGALQPTHFGVWRNTVDYRNFTLSFSISYKFGAYFRQPSVSYGQYPIRWVEHADYADRWVSAGDENRTHIPSNDYGSTINRSAFYLNSEVLVHKSDMIRFEDIQFAYNIRAAKLGKYFSALKFYGVVSNLGLMWTANNAGIDPYFNNIPSERPRFSLGASLTL